MATYEEVVANAVAWQRQKREDGKRTRYDAAWAQRFIGAGLHPVTRLSLRGDAETCGTCVHAVEVGGHARDYWKCDLRITSSEATDIRLRWPACVKWHPKG